jgi:hypothetical protein
MTASASAIAGDEEADRADSVRTPDDAVGHVGGTSNSEANVVMLKKTVPTSWMPAAQNPSRRGVQPNHRCPASRITCMYDR